MAFLPSAIGRSFDQQMLRSSAPGRRGLVVASSGPQLPHAHSQPIAEQRLPAHTRLLELSEKLSQNSQASSSAPASPRPVLFLSSTTSAAAAAAAEASLPTAFARLIVGAALALSTIYALLSSPASGFAGASPTSPTSPISPSLDASPSPSTTTTSTTTSTATSIAALPVLRTPQQFDAFVIASNRVGYLAIVLFHAPWCAASQRMELELQHLAHIFVGRRVVFARVDCSIKQGVRPGQPLGQRPSPGFALQRCDLTQLHRIHKTPTMRMYYNNACVDEIIGCRPVDFRQAASDMTFKYKL